MTSMHPNERYNRYGEYVEEQAPKVCNCICHRPGYMAMHVVACCNPPLEDEQKLNAPEEASKSS